MTSPQDRGRPPTEKQLKFAAAIAETLHVRLPFVQTRQSLFLFIRDNRPRYERLKGGFSHWTDYLDRDEDSDIAEAMGIDLMTGGLADD